MCNASKNHKIKSRKPKQSEKKYLKKVIVGKDSQRGKSAVLMANPFRKKSSCNTNYKKELKRLWNKTKDNIFSISFVWNVNIFATMQLSVIIIRRAFGTINKTILHYSPVQMTQLRNSGFLKRKWNIYGALTVCVLVVYVITCCYTWLRLRKILRIINALSKTFYSR